MGGTSSTRWLTSGGLAALYLRLLAVTSGIVFGEADSPTLLSWSGALFSYVFSLWFSLSLRSVRGSFAKPTPGRLPLSASVLSSVYLRFPCRRLPPFLQSLPSAPPDNRLCIFPDSISSSCYR